MLKLRETHAGTPCCPPAGPASTWLAGTWGAGGLRGCACPPMPSPPSHKWRHCVSGCGGSTWGLTAPSLDAVTPALCLCLWGIQRPGLLGPPGPSAAASRSPRGAPTGDSGSGCTEPAWWAEASRLLHPRAGWRAACPPLRSLRSLSWS